MRDNVRLEVKTNLLDPPVFWGDELSQSLAIKKGDTWVLNNPPLKKKAVSYTDYRGNILEDWYWPHMFKNSIRKIIHSGPCTIVIWNDGTKTIVRRSKFDREDRYAAVAQAIVKKLYGSTNAFHKMVDKKYTVHVSKKEIKFVSVKKETMRGYSLEEIGKGIQNMAKAAQEALESLSGPKQEV